MRPPEVLFAPMAGFTDAATRSIAIQHGAPMCTTEMISAKGLTYGNRRTEDLLRTMDNEKKVIVQIFGSDPAVMRDGAQIVRERMGDKLFAIDINMGCPAPKIFNNGEGAALMGDPKKAARIVRAVKDAVSVPLSVKIRSGITRDSINAVPFALVLADAGANWITVHGRTRSQQYSGAADWDIIREVAAAVPVPVIGNGDVSSAADAGRMRECTRCAGVMIARSAIGNPFLFEQFGAGKEGRPAGMPSPAERIGVLLRHLSLAIADKGERRGILEMRAQIPKYLRGIRGAGEMRARLVLMLGQAEIEDALHGYLRQISDCKEPSDLLN